VQGGFPKEVLSLASTLFFPIGLAVSVLVGAKIKVGHEMDWMLSAYLFRFLDTFIQYLLVMVLPSLGRSYLIMIIVVTILKT
jgi:hypothetical protein